MLDAQHSWESQPNRCNPIYDTMFRYAGSRKQHYDPDTAKAAICEWLFLGQHTGYRNLEWCQDTATTFATKFEHPDQPSIAFLAEDFVFLSADEYITPPHLLSKLHPHTTVIMWRFQKNRNNGEEIPFHYDKSEPLFYPVAAFLHIIQGAKRLQTPADNPIAVYMTQAKTRRFLRASNITNYL